MTWATPDQFWTEEDRKLAISMLGRGASSTEIGAMLGRTRNAIEGKISRDKELAEARVPGGHRRARPYQKAVAAAATDAPLAGNVSTSPAKLPAAAPRRSVPAPLPARPKLPRLPKMFLLPLTDVRSNECMWPVKESRSVIGGQLFCAAEVGAYDRRYCAYHYAISRGHAVAGQRVAEEVAGA